MNIEILFEDPRPSKEQTRFSRGNEVLRKKLYFAGMCGATESGD